MKPIDSSEEDDFRKELGEAGFDPRDFSISFKRSRADIGAQFVYTLQEEVTICRQSTKVEKT
jgi:hypothetical protein